MAWSRFLTLAMLVAVLCITAAGCGSSSTSLATADAARLHQDVASIRSAANRRDPAAAHAAVRTLEADISHLRASGRLAPADALVLLADAGQSDRRVTVDVRAPAAPASTNTSAPASPAASPGSAPPPEAGPGNHGPGKGDGKGKGHGHGGKGVDGGD
jgi:hypothetical protein